MTNTPVITPSEGLVASLRNSAPQRIDAGVTRELWLINQAYQAGADQELEACCEWFICDWTDIETADKLRTARRPKPPSLKEQALEGLTRLVSTGEFFSNQMKDLDTIRRALEALPE
jgi:hypothetical protein